MVIDDKRARILDAAGHEFAAKGFEGATVRSICERAGMNLAAINYHFGDKERLYEEVVLLAHRSGPKLDPRSLVDLDPREALRRFISGFVQRVFDPPQSSWHQAIMFQEMASPTRASDTLIREAIRPQFQILLSVLDRLAPGLDERRLTAVGVSVVGQCLHYRFCGSMTRQIVGPIYHEMTPDFLAAHITQFSLAALGHEPPPTGVPASQPEPRRLVPTPHPSSDRERGER